ncbi:V-set domain-containing T-cell activation inhibitor 1-like [Fundulus diaphanus]
MKLHLRRTLPQVFLLCFVASVICLDLVSEGQVGKSVLLPCSSTKSSAVNVFWRDGNNLALMDIIQGQTNLGTQDVKYKGRVSSFSNQFLNKNYSIVLDKLVKNDTGDYKCTVVSDGVGETTRVSLTVTEDVGNSATCGASNVLQMFVLSALSLLLF